MVESYPGKYCDKTGEETTTIQNDGKILWMVLRGIEFVGNDFHWFEPSEHGDESKLEQFSLFLGGLCSYTLDCDIPVLIVEGNKAHRESLRIHVEYGEPVEGPPGTIVHRKDGFVFRDSRQIGHEVLQLESTFGGGSFKTSGRNMYSSFDEQLTELRNLLPEGVYLKTCWSCAFSDYHPAGSGSFGGLACFRNNKDEYRRVKTKRELLSLWEKRVELVQEIHLCSEFEKRQSRVGSLYVG